jgi:hypothetical protein
MSGVMAMNGGSLAANVGAAPKELRRPLPRL